MVKKIKNYLGRNFKRERSLDQLSGKARSKLMSGIRSKNTFFERDFIKALRKLTSLRFSTHVTAIKGKPDIVFRGQKICVFLDSDFWHGWQYPRLKHLLKNDFWRNKIESNRLRDRDTTRHLRRLGWRVIRIWEHSIKQDRQRELAKILHHLQTKNLISWKRGVE